MERFGDFRLMFWLFCLRGVLRQVFEAVNLELFFIVSDSDDADRHLCVVHNDVESGAPDFPLQAVFSGINQRWSACD